MKKSMTFPIRFWASILVCLLIVQFSTKAVADWCSHKTDIEMTLSLSGTEELTINALAGELDVVGVAGLNEAVIHGTVCSSKESWLEEANIITQAGKTADITVQLPASSGWSLMGSNNISMDLRIEVPNDLPLNIKDSSGDLELNGVGSVDLKDSSGDIEIENSTGAIVIRDSSGDIDIDEVDGNITVVSDSSGDINVENVEGDVLVEKDSSGDISIAHVKDNVIVLRDSSGDISADDVGGDFKVVKDGSGGIHSSDIKGQIDIPKKG